MVMHPSQHNLGVMHISGLGVPQNKVFAYIWFDLSSQFGDDAAIKNRGKKKRDKVAETMTVNEIEDAVKQSKSLSVQIKARR